MQPSLIGCLSLLFYPEFDRHFPAQFLIFGLKHFLYAAFADFLRNAVMQYVLTDFRYASLRKKTYLLLGCAWWIGDKNYMPLIRISKEKS
jgi:hypothetical protein